MIPYWAQKRELEERLVQRDSGRPLDSRNMSDFVGAELEIVLALQLHIGCSTNQFFAAN